MAAQETSSAAALGGHESARALLRVLAGALEQSPSAVAIADRAGYIEFVNPAFARLTGYELAESLGKHLSSLRGNDRRNLEGMWGLLSEGKAWSGRVLAKHKNGTDYWIAAVLLPIRDPDGAINHFIAISERQDGASPFDLEPLEVESPDFTVVIDREGAILFTSGSVAGVPLENTMRASIFDGVLEHERPRLHDYIETVFATGEAISFEIDGVGPHRSASLYVVQLGPIKHGRKVVALSLLSTDLTRRGRGTVRSPPPAPDTSQATPVSTARSAEELAASHDLTERELEVLALLAQGLTDRQLAERFGLSRRTIGHHVSHILRKLDVPNRTAAALAAREAGLLPEASGE